MGLWIGMLAGLVMPPTAFGTIDWHLHEMLYGYLPAVIAGFLLTAVPNWTGRLPVIGMPLMLLVLLWLLGRVAVFFSAYLGPISVAVIDVAFLAMLNAALSREIIAGRNWRNLSVAALLTLMMFGNLAFHAERGLSGDVIADFGVRLGIAGAVILIMLIGGRIIPSFTRNWLSKREPGRLPTPFGRFDMLSIGVAGSALAVWIVLPNTPTSGWACFLAGLLQLMRLLRWAGERSLSEGLVLIMHVGYAFVPLGFFLLGFSILDPDTLATSVALHAWTAGAIGVMTVAVMTRASLGHTGRHLHATVGVALIYICIVLSPLMRIAAGFADNPTLGLYGAGALWMGGFALFTIIYAPMLLRPRKPA